MAVLFISHKYPPSLGGMQKQSYELITGYAHQHKTYKLVYDQQSSIIFFFLKMFWVVPRLLRQHPEIQLIHFNDGVCAVCCAWMKLFTDKALVVTYHGLDLVFPNVIYQKVILPFMKKFDGVITVSDYTKSECLKRGFSPEKVHVVKNGVDLSAEYTVAKVDPLVKEQVRLLKEKQQSFMLAIGRPVKRKGFVWFLEEVVFKMKAEGTFILVGPYPQHGPLHRLLQFLPAILRKQIELFFGMSTEHHQLDTLSQSLDNRNKFIWYKNLNHDSKLYLLEQASFLVMPNVKVTGDMEGFGLVALEANIHNTPVLAADMEGITSAVIPNRNGWLLESENPEAWMAGVETYLNEPPQLSPKAFVIDNFGWQKMVDDYATTFNNILTLKQVV
jgi:glycosyltransferase involved in cell wall biosynthesis